MYSDPILEEKWKTQKALAKKVDYDIKRLIQNAHVNTLEVVKRLRISPKYSKLSGGYI